MDWERLMGGRGGGTSCCWADCGPGLLGEESVAEALDLEASGISLGGDCSGSCRTSSNKNLRYLLQGRNKVPFAVNVIAT